MKLSGKTIRAIGAAAIISLLTVPAFAGNGYGPGDGSGPEEGSDYGPGDCEASLQLDVNSQMLLAKGGSAGNGGNGKGSASGDQTQDKTHDRAQDGSC